MEAGESDAWRHERVPRGGRSDWCARARRAGLGVGWYLAHALEVEYDVEDLARGL